MKRMLSILLCSILLLTGCSASQTENTPEGTPYQLYFLVRDLTTAAGDGALRAETTYLAEQVSLRQTAVMLMEDLLKGPLSEELRSPIPLGTALESVEIRGSQAVVDLSSAYGSLSGVSLSLADYAITLTLTQLPEIMSVRITVQGQEVAYRDRQVFTSREVLLAPQGDVVSTVRATLYFLDSDGTLTAEERELELYEGDTQVIAVTRAMENGPESKGLNPVLPETFRVKNVWQEDDVCYVNLSSALLVNLPMDAELSAGIRALGQALCSLESVSETWFLVDGKFVRNYGSVNVESPYTD